MNGMTFRNSHRSQPPRPKQVQPSPVHILVVAGSATIRDVIGGPAGAVFNNRAVDAGRLLTFCVCLKVAACITSIPFPQFCHVGWYAQTVLLEALAPTPMPDTRSYRCCPRN